MNEEMQQYVDKIIILVVDSLGFGFDSAIQCENKWAIVCHHVNENLKRQGIKLVVE
jgi:hypothetical protein